MSEDNLFDEIARSLASPMSRRKVLGRLIGGLAVAALATISRPNRAQAAQTCNTDADCGSGSFCCNKQTCCSTGQVCCGSGANSKCCASGSTCCGSGANTICCSSGQECTGHGNTATCRTASPR